MEPNTQLSKIVGLVTLSTLAFVGCRMPTGPTNNGVGYNAAAPVSGGAVVQASSATAEDFAARGWECRQSPVPGRVACSHPNQGFPVAPPPTDRPATYQLKAWQDGVYAGTILLIRPDLYNGQPCESTGEAYIFRPVIGYYECLHTTGT
jgi:hypothetical protein